MEEKEKTIDKLDLPDIVKDIVVDEIKEEAKKELKEDIKNGNVEDFKVEVKKFWLKSKIFWTNAISSFFAVMIYVLPELIAFLMGNVDFVQTLKEYSNTLYLILFSVASFVNISLRFKNQDTLSRKKDIKKEEDKEDGE